MTGPVVEMPHIRRGAEGAIDVVYYVRRGRRLHGIAIAETARTGARLLRRI